MASGIARTRTHDDDGGDDGVAQDVSIVQLIG